MDLESIWKRICAWYEANCPPGKFDLGAGVSDDAIAEFESVTGVLLPEDVKQSYRIHNGGLYSAANYGAPYLCHFGEFLSLERSLDQWRMYREMEKTQGYGQGVLWETDAIVGPIDPEWNPVTRFPVTDNSGDHLIIDTVSRLGTPGQVIDHSHEIGPEAVIAPSWHCFLEQLADDLESGEYVYDEEEETVCPPGMYD